MNKKRFWDIFRIGTDTPKNRLEYLDFLRGAAMLLVLLHHSNVPNGEWILSFHMPLLFALSGYADAHRERLGLSHPRKFTDYFFNRFKRLAVPYFLFEGVNLFVWAVSLISQGGWQDVTDALFAILTCQNTEGYTGYYGRLWFLPCMFVSDIFFYLIKRVCKGHNVRLILSAALMLVISWCTCNVLSFRLPFAADTAFMATAFLILGYLLEPQITYLLTTDHVLRDTIFSCTMLAIMVYCVVYQDSSCLMFINHYRPFVWSVLAAITGSSAFFILAKWAYRLLCKVRFGKKLVLWYGYNSLATFPVHLSIKIWVINHFGWRFPWLYLLLIMLVFNIPIVNFIRMYLPFMLGDFSMLIGKKAPVPDK